MRGSFSRGKHLRRRKSPATPTRRLIFGRRHNALLAPVKVFRQVSSGDVSRQIGRGVHDLVRTAGLGATNFVLELRRCKVRKLRYRCCSVEVSPWCLLLCLSMWHRCFVLPSITWFTPILYEDGPALCCLIFNKFFRRISARTASSSSAISTRNLSSD